MRRAAERVDVGQSRCAKFARFCLWVHVKNRDASTSRLHELGRREADVELIAAFVVFGLADFYLFRHLHEFFVALAVSPLHLSYKSSFPDFSRSARTPPSRDVEPRVSDSELPLTVSCAAGQIRLRNEEQHTSLQVPHGPPIREATPRLCLCRCGNQPRAAKTVHFVCVTLVFLYRQLDRMKLDLFSSSTVGKLLTIRKLSGLTSVRRFRVDHLADDSFVPVVTS